jgi:polyhydroxybutyrate depolymerase
MRVAVVIPVLVVVAIAASGCGGGGGAGTTPTTAQRPAAAGGCQAQAAGAYRVPVQDGRVPVILHVPPGSPPAGGRWPIVVQLPGAGQDGVYAEAYTGESQLADQQGFMVAYPTAAGKSPSWNVSGKVRGKPDDVTYLRRVLQRLSGPNICADARRVYVTGASNGGGMTAALACAAPDLIAAAAPVAGGYSSLPRCGSRKAVPLMEVHSLTDQVVPYGGKGADHAGAVGAFLAGWRTRNGCSGVARRSAPATGVTSLRWECDGAPVVHDRLRAARHGWYGGASLDPGATTARTWAFMKGFRLASAPPAPQGSSSAAR